MESRALLAALFDAAVRAVDPVALVTEALGRRGDAVYVRSRTAAGGREFVFVPNRLVLLSVGKAAEPMARAAAAILGPRLAGGLVISPFPAVEPLAPGLRLLETSHPHPDDRSAAAGDAALALAARLQKGDLFLVLLSGGGSALMAAPPERVTLAEKSRTASLLMAAGAPVADVNLVRGALSRVKAGRLAVAAGNADVVTLVLSDLGDEGWHYVGSGPTMGLPPHPRDALALLERYRLLPLVPAAVRTALEGPVTPFARPTVGNHWAVLLADIRTALEGARLEALRLGADARVVPELLAGEARAAARRLAVAGACAGNLRRRPGGAGRPLVTIFGGETTVTVKGLGRGGRNRELALATAYPIAGVDGATVLCAGTDGVDYGPEAAGAFADHTTLDRADAAGLDPARALLDNDTGPFFETLGDSFAPGPTGTNVGDVAFVLAPRG